MCIRQQSAFASATTTAISGSPRNAVTSLTSVAPDASARAATLLLDVSIEIWARVPSDQALDHREHPPQLLVLGTGAAPGLDRLAADVEERGPFGLELGPVGDRERPRRGTDHRPRTSRA